VGVKEAVRKLREAHVSLILLSDTPEQDLYYGHALGLFDKKTKLLRAGEQAILPEEGNCIVETPSVETASLSANVRQADYRYEHLRALLQRLPKTVDAEGNETSYTGVLVRSVLDTRLLQLGDVAVAVGDSDTRPLCQPLKADADVILYPTDGQGGLSEMVGTMVQSRRALFHLWGAAVYLCTSQLSRIILLLFSVFLQFAMPSPASLLLVGLLSDFAAVLAMAFGGASPDILAISSGRLGLPRGKKMVAGVIGLSVFWGLCQVGLLFLCDFLHLAYIGVLLASMVLAQLLFSGTVGMRESFFKARFSVAYGLYALGAVLVACAFLFFYPTMWYANFLSLLPGILMLLVWEIAEKKKRCRNLL